MNSFKPHESEILAEQISMKAYWETEKLLKLYRRILFRSKRQLKLISAECQVASRRALTDYIDILLEFDTSAHKHRICDRLESISSTLCLLEVMEDALSLLSSYPDNGELYYYILEHAYFEEHPLTHEEIMENQALSRSTYYRRRGDAVETYAIMLWGYSIPKIYQKLA